MQVIGCKECGSLSIEFGNVFVDVNLKKVNLCETCQESKTETTNYFFCSLACFSAFMLKAVDGKAEFKMK